jgi:hypothetical protein
MRFVLAFLGLMLLPPTLAEARSTDHTIGARHSQGRHRHHKHRRHKRGRKHHKRHHRSAEF